MAAATDFICVAKAGAIVLTLVGATADTGGAVGAIAGVGVAVADTVLPVGKNPPCDLPITSLARFASAA